MTAASGRIAWFFRFYKLITAQAGMEPGRRDSERMTGLIPVQRAAAPKGVPLFLLLILPPLCVDRAAACGRDGHGCAGHRFLRLNASRKLPAVVSPAPSFSLAAPRREADTKPETRPDCEEPVSWVASAGNETKLLD